MAGGNARGDELVELIGATRSRSLWLDTVFPSLDHPYDADPLGNDSVRGDRRVFPGAIGLLQRAPTDGILEGTPSDGALLPRAVAGRPETHPPPRQPTE